MTIPRATVIGAGQVGATAAHLLALKGLAHVTLIDVVEGLAQGKALDISQSAPVEGIRVSVTGTTNLDAAAGSQLVIITAGLARKPGMSRDDLLAANANIVGPIAERIGRVAPNAILIIVTNPLDVMVALALQRSGFPRHRVMPAPRRTDPPLDPGPATGPGLRQNEPDAGWRKEEGHDG